MIDNPMGSRVPCLNPMLLVINHVGGSLSRVISPYF